MGKPANHQPLLQERDIKIIFMAYRYNGVTMEIVKRRFWPSAKSKASYYQRIQVLIKAGYLHSMMTANPFSGYHGVMWLTHGPKARALMAEMTKLPLDQIAVGSRTVSPLRVAHSTLINEIRASLEIAEESYNSLTILNWYSETYFKHNPLVVRASPVSKERIIEPDAAFTIQTQRSKLSAFLEADRGTITSHLDLRARFRDYLLYQRTLRTPRPVLWVVPAEARVKQLSTLAAQEAEVLHEDPTIFFVTTREKVNENSLLFGPIWKVVGGPDQKALFDEVPITWQNSNQLIS